MLDFLRPHGLYRLLCPWNSPGHSRILEWVAIPFSRGVSQPRDWIQVCIADEFFTIWATMEAHFRKLPSSLMASNGGISGPYVSVLTCTWVYLEVLVAPSDQCKKATPTHQLLGNSVTSIIPTPCSYTSARGSGKLISFARKGLWNVWDSAGLRTLHTQGIALHSSPSRGSLGQILHLFMV